MRERYFGAAFVALVLCATPTFAQPERRAEATEDGSASGASAEGETWTLKLLGVSGPKSDAVILRAKSTLAKNGVNLVAVDGELGSGETGLEMKVSLLKRGRERWRATLVLKDADGQVLGSVTYRGRNLPKLNKAVRAGTWLEFGELIEKQREQWIAAKKKAQADARAASKAKQTKAKKKAPAKLGLTTHQGRVTKDLIHIAPDGTKLFRYETVAARRKGKIKIDGKDDEAAWKAAKETMGNWKQRPDERGVPTGEVYFRILYDDDAIYAFVFARDPEPKKVAGILTRGDTFDKSELSDWLILAIDPTRNRRDSYGFQVNPSGVRIDYRIFNDNQLDITYDPIYEVATRKRPDGWAAEYRVPYSQLRVKEGAQDKWGLQIWRRVARTGEHYMWSPYPLQTRRGTSQYGDVVIDANIEPKRAFEIIAYTAGGLDIRPTPSADTLNDDVSVLGRIGGDVQLALTSELQLSGTILPDFGQVDADPALVNLTDRENFFLERRPFFTKDDDLFQQAIGPGFERLYYTRRVGASPRLRPQFFSQNLQFADEPRETTIYGAAKLSGQLPGGIKLGALSVVTAEEKSRGQEADGNVFEIVSEPETYYNVLQLGKVFRGGDSEFRLLGTSVNRRLKGTDIDFLSRGAYSGGATYIHRFADSKWSVNTQLLGSLIEGEEPAITFLQQSSVRYSQRPDATHVDFDPNKNILSGMGGAFEIDKLAGKWTGKAGVEARTPGFETNDIGFLLDADYIRSFGEIRFEEWLGGRVRAYGGRLGYQGIGNFGGDILRHVIDARANVRFDTDSEGFLRYQQVFNRLDTRLLRGGPSIAGSNSTTIGGTFITSPRKSAFLQGSLDYTIRPDSYSRRHDASLTLTWNILNNLDLILAPTVSRIIDDTQFVDGLTLPADMDGNARFPFANVKRYDVSTIIRINYTVSPFFLIQLYAQPFVSTRNFRSYRTPTDLQTRNYDRRFTTIASREMDGMVDLDLNGDGVFGDFSFQSPDRSVASLNTNLVARWEYRPGSFATAVWSHQAQSFDPDGFISSRDFGNIWNKDGAHVFLLKIQYWWSR